MKKLIFFLLIQFVINNTIYQYDFCFEQEACTGKHDFSCLSGLCSRDALSCQSLKLWAIINNHIRKEQAGRTLERFLLLIEECQRWNSSQICLNNAICYQNFKIPYRLLNGGKKINPKPTKCKCTYGKYRHTCGKEQNYCATDKAACKSVVHWTTEIMKCKK